MDTHHRSLPTYLSCSTAITDSINAKQPIIRVVEIQGGHLKKITIRHTLTLSMRQGINKFNVLQMERPQLQQQPYQA